jgi:DNA repair exonuclease SbcCD ATPase subunit
MKPIRLYVENFMCHERSYIDFTQFRAALIVGKVDNNELYSNGVGKTTIFKAIEYVLFNQADVNLEKIIRDDTNSCKITMDFIVDNVEYRLARTRTKKGATDLSLAQRTANDGLEKEVYHIVMGTSDNTTPVTEEKYWKDISGRRAADTEKDLAKLIKLNFKSFRSTIHFLQNDFTGLTTATPEKRKGILKDALDLLIYSKLEKIAKDKSSSISKNIDKHKVLIENLGDPALDLVKLSTQLSEIELILLNINIKKDKFTTELSNYNSNLNDLVNAHSNLEEKFSSLLIKEKSLLAEKSRLEISVKEYTSKTANISKSAKELINEIKELQSEQLSLIKLDYSQIDILGKEVISQKETITHHNIVIQNDNKELEELRIPMPDHGVCKDCRQPITEKHKKECKTKLAKDIQELQGSIKNSKQIISNLNAKINISQQSVNALILSKQQLDNVNIKISTKNKEVLDKKNTYNEYSALLTKFTTELVEKNKEIEEVSIQLKASSIDEAEKIKGQIEEIKKNIISTSNSEASLIKDITSSSATKAVIQHNIDQKLLDKAKCIELKKELLDLENNYMMYPSVIQAFSSTGIPNLIIQNVLDDLQIEANTLLSQLKPGLQLSFFVEKTKGDGTETDTLDINYHINGKERYYEQLSGAMKLAVTFSLKLGLSFLLQKMIGTDIKLLLLDEIDQSLDKASVDAFADIVKFFQKDFTILIITHNDRLKDKFSHAILVEQDINMISRAKVVSSW